MVKQSNCFISNQLLYLLICIIIPIIILLMPETEYFTKEIKIYIAITLFIISIVSFELFDILIPSILLPSLYCISGIVDASTAFISWTNTIIYMIIGAFTLTNVLESCGLLNRIALFCIKKCGGTFNGTLYGLLLTGIILAAVTFNNAYIIMITLGYGICKTMNLEKSNQSAVLMMAAGISANTVGVFMYDPAMMSLLQANAQTVIPDFKITWVEQFIYNAPLFFFLVLFCWIMTKIYKTKNLNSLGKEYFKNEYDKLGPISKKEKIALVVLSILMVFLLSSPFHGIDITYGFMLLPWILFLPGINVGTKQDIKNLPYGTIFFIAACLGIGMVGNALGASKIISTFLAPILEGQHILYILYVVLGLGILANLFMTPFAMVASLSGPVAQVVSNLELSLWPPLLALYHSCFLIFLPYEIPVWLVLFGFGMISMKNFILLSALNVFLFLLYFGIVMVPYWTLLGLF